jgi:hypothetical protein
MPGWMTGVTIYALTIVSNPLSIGINEKKGRCQHNGPIGIPKSPDDDQVDADYHKNNGQGE